MKEEALKLADDLEELHEQDLIDGVAHLSMPQASAMIRRLVEELDKQNPSVFTILTCGCKSEFMGFPSEWDGETRECEPCVNYGSLCEQHFMEYEARPAQYTPQTKPLERTDVYGLAIESGFMLSTQHGQEEHKLMPVTDGDTLMQLVKAIEERHGIK